MNKKIRTQEVEQLFEAILQLKDTEECFEFFEDLCTMKEVHDLSQRLEIARLLDEGSSYQQAASMTGVSSATIGRVKRCLDYGTGGSRMILNRLKEANTRDDG